MILNVRFSTLCYGGRFIINGIVAKDEDFGEQYDRDPDSAEDEGGCGDMQFTAIPPTSKVLTKYKITEQEYYEVCAALKEDLSFGLCNECC